MIARARKMLARLDGGQGLAGGAGLAFAIRLGGAGLGFALSIVLARTLGPAETGLYFLALTVVGIAALLGRLGLENALLRMIAVAAGNGDWSMVRAISRRSLFYAGMASLLVTAVLFLISPLLATVVFHKPDLQTPLQWLALAVVPMAGIVLLGEMLKALGRIRDSQLVQSVVTPLVALVLYLLVFRAAGLAGAAYAFLSAIAITWMVAAMLWYRGTPHLRGAARVPAPPILRAALPFMSIQAMNTVNEWVDVLVLGMFAPVEQVGIYAIAKRITVIIGFVLIAVNNVVSPRIARLHAQGDFAGLAALAVSAARLSLLSAGPLLAIALIAPVGVMRLFGEGFADGWLVLVILALGQLVNLSTASAAQVLAMSGHEKTLHNVILVSTVVTIMLNILLVPIAGAVGAAIAVSIGGSLTKIMAVIQVNKKLGIRIGLV